MNTRRTFLKTTAQLSIGSLFLTHLAACKSGDKKVAEATMEEIKKQLTIAADAPYKMDYLRGDIGYFTERGGTIGWMAGEDGMVVVDTQFPDQSKNLVGELQKLSSNKMDLLINTHHHGDHTAGNPVYAELTDRILAHENSKANQMRVAEANNQEGQVFPTETFAETHTEKIGKETISLNYWGPAHTDGDAVTHFQNANVVHMGDLVFNRRFPYIDKSSGASISNWIQVLDKTTSAFDNETIFIFGHAGENHDIIGEKEDINAFKNYLERLLEFGKTSIAEGKTLDDLKANVKVIPGAEEWTGGGIERSLDAVYMELKG
jgi:glyoxylase-like metal-dependent hydrolase (beta-lactamase superfamily II)